MSGQEQSVSLHRESRAREMWADNLEKRGYPLSAASIRKNDGDPFHDATIETIVAFSEGEISTVDAFEMGCGFQSMLFGQNIEDSRAVGRLLGSDTFAAISDRIDAEIKRQGFNSFQSADLGICAAKRIINAALSPLCADGS